MKNVAERGHVVLHDFDHLDHLIQHRFDSLNLESQGDHISGETFLLLNPMQRQVTRRVDCDDFWWIVFWPSCNEIGMQRRTERCGKYSRFGRRRSMMLMNVSGDTGHGGVIVRVILAAVIVVIIVIIVAFVEVAATVGRIAKISIESGLDSPCRGNNVGAVGVESAAVGEDQSHIGLKFDEIDIELIGDLFLDGGEVHWILDDDGICWNGQSHPVDGMEESPAVWVLNESVEDPLHGQIESVLFTIGFKRGCDEPIEHILVIKVSSCAVSVDRKDTNLFAYHWIQSQSRRM